MTEGKIAPEPAKPNLKDVVSSVATRAISGLKETVKKINPDAKFPIAGAIYFGTMAAVTSSIFVANAISLIPQGGSFLDGIKEFADIAKGFYGDRAYQASVLQFVGPENGVAVGQTLASPVLAAGFTLFASIFGANAYRIQKGK